MKSSPKFLRRYLPLALVGIVCFFSGVLAQQAQDQRGTTSRKPAFTDTFARRWVGNHADATGKVIVAIGHGRYKYGRSHYFSWVQLEKLRMQKGPQGQPCKGLRFYSARDTTKEARLIAVSTITTGETNTKGDTIRTDLVKDGKKFTINYIVDVAQEKCPENCDGQAFNFQ